MNPNEVVEGDNLIGPQNGMQSANKDGYSNTPQRQPAPQQPQAYYEQQGNQAQQGTPIRPGPNELRYRGPGPQQLGRGPNPEYSDFDFTKAGHPVACFFHFFLKILSIFSYFSVSEPANAYVAMSWEVFCLIPCQRS